MVNRKPRERRAHDGAQQYQHQQQQQQHYQQQIQPQHQYTTDYETDTGLYFSDTNTAAAAILSQSQPPPQTRTNEELNLSVLSRHNPSISAILSTAHYAVVYTFSAASSSWEKNGVEGTLFVCSLYQGELGEERYSVMVLNRRGMENFSVELRDGEDVELTPEYIILKVGDEVFGIWIFSEPPPSSTAESRTVNAQLIKECAVHAGESRKIAEERAASVQNGNGNGAAMPAAVPMGRQISLKDLFGQQRANDDSWSVRTHDQSGGSQQMYQQQQMPMPMQQQYGFPQHQVPQTQQQQQAQGPNVLGDLFRKAGLA